MALDLRPRKRFTVKEYLALEEVATEKSEFYEGEIYAMAGASASRNRISNNVQTELSVQLYGSPCEVFPSDMRLLIEAFGLYTYPDAMVICGKLELALDGAERGTGGALNPVVLIEVLSSSTADYNRGQKSRFYQSIPTLRHYLLLDQYRVHVEHRFLASDGTWQSEAFTDLDDSVSLASLNVRLGVRRLYERVAWT